MARLALVAVDFEAALRTSSIAPVASAFLTTPMCPRPRHLIFLACIFCAWLISSCASRQSAPPVVEEDSARLLAEELDALRTRHRISSAAVGVVDPGGTLFLHESNESGDPRIYHLASVSKIVTATAVMQLVESESLSLDSSVSALIGTKLENPHLASDPITVRQLLNHTSGLRLDDGAIRQVVPAGWNERYLNENYALLASVVEKVTGGKFDDYLDTAVWRPLGVRAHRNSASNIASGALPTGAGQVLLTAEDFARFCAALLEPGPLLGPSAHRQLLTDTAPGIEPPCHLAWRASYSPAGKLVAVYHAGSDRAAGAELILRPDRHAAYFVLSSSRYSPDFFREAIDTIERYLKLPPRNSSASPPPKNSALEGSYSPSSTSPPPITVSQISGKLQMTLAGGQSLTLGKFLTGHFAAYDQGLDDDLGASLALAGGETVEFIVFEGKVKGLVWKNQFYRRMAAP